jgi:hypothetical protein
MRFLSGRSTQVYEFTGDTLSEVLTEVALMCTKWEKHKNSVSIRQEWNEDEGCVVYAYVSQ